MVLFTVWGVAAALCATGLALAGAHLFAAPPDEGPREKVKGAQGQLDDFLKEG